MCGNSNYQLKPELCRALEVSNTSFFVEAYVSIALHDTTNAGIRGIFIWYEDHTLECFSLLILFF